MLNQYLLLLIIGSILGSFVNVLIDRLPSGKYFSRNRSFCESCKKTLKWYDLFPILSYIFLKGKCRYCKKPIPYRLPIVELLTGIGFVLIYILTPVDQLICTPFYLVLFALFVAIFFIDSMHQIIPDVLLLCIGVITVVLHVFSGVEILPYIVTGVASTLFFLALFLGTKGRGMGFGDVKFAFVIGLLLGFPGSLVAFYAAFVVGAIVSIGLILSKRKKLKGSKIAFGPFMIVGMVIALLYAENIMALLF
ncbi:MAG TPA: prepilin peptidase [Candidatus Levybacteria bacterium]|nr:prepilin peptidase [Candidatus Levybacteria bacterium]